MYIRFALALGVLATVGGCGRVVSEQPEVDGERIAPSSGNLVNPAFYQTSTVADLEASDVDRPMDETSAQVPAVGTGNEFEALFERLQARMDELHNQNRQILAALGIDGQQPAPPPPKGSLADQVLDLQEAVKVLAANGEALRRVIEEQTVTLKPALPVSTDGRLTVENNTDDDRQMWINGTSYWIWANSKLTVLVPAGEVTTKVLGEEARTWEIAVPGEEVRIEIVRTSQVAATVDP
jgi:hypothetical protein